jgi:hypothetical protein
MMSLFKQINLNHFVQLVELETVNNHLTQGIIKGTYVHVHYYHDVPIEDNNAIVFNDQNNAFNEVFIDVLTHKSTTIKVKSIHNHRSLPIETI